MERARKVNINGEQVTLEPGGLSEAPWAKQPVWQGHPGPVPNGYCGLPIQKSCQHENACFSELTV